MTTSAPYGTWPSPITAQLISAGAKGLEGLTSNDADLFWLESRPTEGGRTVLVRHRGAVSEDLTPPPYSVRSRVHEYGGGALAVSAHSAFFVNFTDQDVYRVDLTDGGIDRITHTDAGERYADMQILPDDAGLIAVCERHGQDAGEPENLIVHIDVSSGSTTDLCAGHDFYAHPRLSPDLGQLAYVCWDHPNMPWDGTQLHVAKWLGSEVGASTVVAGGVAESAVQPTWIGVDRLLFVSDRTGWWNLYSYDDSGVYCVHPDEAEYSEPPWGLGLRTFAALDDGHVVCKRIEDGEAALCVLGLDNGMRSPLESDWTEFGALTVHRGALHVIAARPDRLSAVVRLDPADGEQLIAQAGDLGVEPAWFSHPEHVTFPTRDGGTGHGYLYVPTNPGARDDSGNAPPVLVTTHGGPTGRTGTGLNLRAQYYTSRGWAVFDVNYGGSSGFGRAYRERLNGQWGVIDVHDCEDGLAHLAAAGRVDPERTAIRGGSAGGYTTLAALTFGERFRAGASHYGIGDLEALARDTHKFESRYLDGLVGPLPEAQQRYIERSPIHHADRLDCPVVFFQGLEDKVVPPNQAEAMVDALKRKGVAVAYVPFEGEYHGFRRAENIERALEAEYQFFAEIFGFTPADPIVPLEIDNW